jgi:hypothetical protein
MSKTAFDSEICARTHDECFTLSNHEIVRKLIAERRANRDARANAYGWGIFMGFHIGIAAALLVMTLMQK